MFSFKQLRQMMQLQGNGTLAVRTQPVSSFTRLHLSVHGTVELRHGSEEKVVIETDDNLLDSVATYNAGQTLYVTTENKLRQPAYSRLRVVVYLRQLQHLDIANYGPVVCPEPLRAIEPLDVRIQSFGDTQLLFQADVLNLHSACAGRVTVAGTAGQVLINNKSEGELDCRDLVAQHLKLVNMGVGNVRVRAEQTIRIQHRGVGFVHYAGSARLLDVQQNGAGEVKHVE
ncbi:head GIN domain-containing protein [Hymenobacter sp.]|uniref:head GIN domain-containing protein n=1 Tax=Hymenobacter sp. TaxID=1898978 RepID=UPI00286AEF3B|nr:head GIN domain-containing protein [Hymenobacter sp.]